MPRIWKRIIPVVLTLLLCLNLLACSIISRGISSTLSDLGVTKEDEEATDASSDISDWGSASAGETGSSGSMDESAESGTLVNSVSFEPIEVVSSDACAITITAFEPDALWGPAFTVLLENRSDKSLTFAIENGIVNGFMCDPYWASDVAAGKKDYSEISFYQDSLDLCGIRYLDEVTLIFRVYDSNDWGADDVFRETVTFRLNNSTTESALRDVTFSHGFTDVVIVDNDQFKVVARDFDPNGEWGATLMLYIENRTDQNLYFSINDASINGFMCDPYWIDYLLPGTKAYSEVYWYTSTLEESKITSISEIEFLFRIYDADDWFADDLFSETVLLTF